MREDKIFQIFKEIYQSQSQYELGRQWRSKLMEHILAEKTPHREIEIPFVGETQFRKLAFAMLVICFISGLLIITLQNHFFWDTAVMLAFEGENEFLLM